MSCDVRNPSLIRATQSPLHVVAMAFLVGFAVTGTLEARPPLGKAWPSSQQISFDSIDHAPFGRLLSSYVDSSGNVDYSRWQRSPDRRKLRAYLADLGRASLTKPASRDAKLAFWINAYNAATIEGILQVYPTSSIRNHTARVFGYNIWKELPLQVGGSRFSLEQIEHEILRKLNEPRIHFAIVCASVGCPRLLDTAYTADAVQEQLAANTKDFFGRSQNLRISSDRRTIFISTILDWFADDFGTTQAKRLAYLRPYFPESARRAAANPSVRLRYLDYDWNLNDQKRLTKR